MRAKCSRRPQGRAAPSPPPAGAKQSGRATSACARGFTLAELIGVLALLAVLAAVAMPRFEGALALRQDAWRDDVLAALRLAHQTALSHRRLVCVTVAATSVSLRIAAANPATTCGTALAGPDGKPVLQAPAGSSTAVAPAGLLYFQPSGRLTSDGAGKTPASRSITIGGVAPIAVVGESGLAH